MTEPSSRLFVCSGRVLTPEGLRRAGLHIEDGRIVGILDSSGAPSGAMVIDAHDSVVMPGIVDTHVHVNEPGRTDWEGFVTATRAAAAGGVTTILDMPLNSIPATTTLDALEAKIAAASDKCLVNVGFIGGVVPGNAGELRSLHEAGVRAFKCFLTPSGVDEFPSVDERDLRAALPVLASLGTPLMVHAELPAFLASATPADPRRYAAWLASRPDVAEVAAVELVTRLAEEFGATVHIVHLSSARSLPLLRAARARGVRVSAETCPHYLTFAADEIADGATQLKCAPPIRNAENREALWLALVDGDVGMVVSDHSPAPPDLKCVSSGDFFAAWGGIASLQFGLPAVWEGARARGVSVAQVARWMCEEPARLAGLSHRKGCLAPGYDADIVIWNPEAMVHVSEKSIQHRHKLTPYLGRTLHGSVEATFVGGRAVFSDGALTDHASGELLVPAHR
jgi:allantoinase